MCLEKYFKYLDNNGNIIKNNKIDQCLGWDAKFKVNTHYFR